MTLFVAAMVGPFWQVHGEQTPRPPATAPAAALDASGVAAVKAFLEKSAATTRPATGPGGTPSSMGEPLAVVAVTNDDLVDSKPGKTANPLDAGGPSKFIVPLCTADGVTSSVLSLQRANGDWTVSKATDPAALASVKSRDNEAKIGKRPKSDFHLVEIRSLNASFIYKSDGEKVKLKAVGNVESAGIKAGAELTPSDALDKLRDAALRYNGAPG